MLETSPPRVTQATLNFELKIPLLYRHCFAVTLSLPPKGGKARRVTPQASGE